MGAALAWTGAVGWCQAAGVLGGSLMSASWQHHTVHDIFIFLIVAQAQSATGSPPISHARAHSGCASAQRAACMANELAQAKAQQHPYLQPIIACYRCCARMCPPKRIWLPCSCLMGRCVATAWHGVAHRAGSWYAVAMAACWRCCRCVGAVSVCVWCTLEWGAHLWSRQAQAAAAQQRHVRFPHWPVCCRPSAGAAPHQEAAGSQGLQEWAGQEAAVHRRAGAAAKGTTASGRCSATRGSQQQHQVAAYSCGFRLCNSRTKRPLWTAHSLCWFPS